MNDVRGIGLGLRIDLAEELIETRPSEVQWLELHPENYLRRGGRFDRVLRRALAHWPVATHGLTMNFGSIDAFDDAELSELGDFLRSLGAPWHSDHLCFGSVDGVFAHDLLPLRFDEPTARLCAERIEQMRDRIDLPVAVENVSYYARSDDPAAEVDFLLEVVSRADARILLDVNNVYVNAANHGFDPYLYLDRIPPDRVVQFHVAGHTQKDDGLRIDTHGAPICEDVYALLAYALRRIGPRPVLLERDHRIPALTELLDEVRRLGEIYAAAVSGVEANAR